MHTQLTTQPRWYNIVADDTNYIKANKIFTDYLSDKMMQPDVFYGPKGREIYLQLLPLGYTVKIDKPNGGIYRENYSLVKIPPARELERADIPPPKQPLSVTKKYELLQDVSVQVMCVVAPCPPVVMAKKGEIVDGFIGPQPENRCQAMRPECMDTKVTISKNGRPLGVIPISYLKEVNAVSAIVAQAKSGGGIAKLISENKFATGIIATVVVLGILIWQKII